MPDPLPRRAAAALAAAVLACAAPALAAGAQRLVPMRAVLADVARAHSVTLCAYSLSPRGRTALALEAAARRGAAVTVALDGRAFGPSARQNAVTAAALVRAGAVVHVTREPLHLKAAVIDGARGYLTDRNWASRNRGEVVLADDDPRDRPLLERAMLGVPGSNDHLWLRKADAVAAEARLLAKARDAAVETESFGAGTPVYARLLALARAGGRVRLVVARAEFARSASERAALAALAAAGVRTRVGRTDEKLAIVAGAAWIGSANLTRGLPDQIDFGLVTRDPELVRRVAAQDAANWAAATAP